MPGAPRPLRPSATSKPSRISFAIAGSLATAPERAPPPKAAGSRSAALVEQDLRDGLQLHIGRTLVDRADLGVAKEFLGPKLLGKPDAAVELHALRGDALGHLARDQLRHRRRTGKVLARIL